MGFKERDLKDIEEIFSDDEITNKKVKNKRIEVRINSGIYSKRKIYVASANMRPTLARAKSILFDIMMNLVDEDFTLFDAFAGTGAIGLEALSRGASKVIFVDINRKNTRSIERNLNEMDKLPGKGIVINKSVLRTIIGSPVNVIFLDPPYDKSGLIPDVIGKLENNNWINEHTIVIIEAHKTFKLQLEKYDIFRERKISSSILYFTKLKNINE